MVLLFFSPVKALNINSCQNLNQEGQTYYLTQNIIDSTNSTCMNIIANNIILDCQGYMIDGVDNGYGIYSEKSNITIKNCFIKDWGEGIYLYLSSDIKIINSTFSSNLGEGILFFSSSNNQVINSTFSYNYYGITNYNSNTQITNSIFSSNEGDGILISYSSNVQITNSTFKSNSIRGLNFYLSNNSIVYNNIIQDNYIGIYLEEGYGNKFYNNLLNNTKNFDYYGTIYPNYWNTTRQTGTRIYSNGTEIGGNYWTNSSGNGYSDTCEDLDYDGFCDQPLNLTINNTDYLPLSNKFGVPPTTTTTTTTVPTTTTTQPTTTTTTTVPTTTTTTQPTTTTTTQPTTTTTTQPTTTTTTTVPTTTTTIPPNFCGNYTFFAYDKYLFKSLECEYQTGDSYFNETHFFIPCSLSRKVCIYDINGNLKNCFDTYPLGDLKSVTSNGTHIFTLQGNAYPPSSANFTVFVYDNNRTLIKSYDITNVCYSGSAYTFCKAIEYYNGLFYVFGETTFGHGGGDRICLTDFPVNGYYWYYCNDNLYIFDSQFNHINTKSIFRGNGITTSDSEIWIVSINGNETYVYNSSINLIKHKVNTITYSYGVSGLSYGDNYFYLNLVTGDFYGYYKEYFEWCYPNYVCDYECDCDNYFGNGYGRQFKVCYDQNMCYRFGQPVCPPYSYRTDEWTYCKKQGIYKCNIPQLDFPPPEYCHIDSYSCPYIAINGWSNISTDIAWVEHFKVAESNHCFKTLSNVSLRIYASQINPFGSLKLNLEPYPYQTNISLINNSISICNCDYETSRPPNFNCSGSYIFGCCWMYWYNLDNYTFIQNNNKEIWFSAYIYNPNISQVSVVKTNWGYDYPTTYSYPQFCYYYEDIESNVTLPNITIPKCICDISVIPNNLEYYPIRFLCLFFNLFCNPIFSFLVLGLIIFLIILLKVMR